MGSESLAAERVEREKAERLSRSATAAVDYTMPVVKPGQTVMWHQSGRVDGHGQMAMVLAVGRNARTIRLMTHVGGLVVDGVRHHTDPRIDENPESVEDGVWDATRYDKDMEQFRAELNDLRSRLDAIAGLSEATPVVLSGRRGPGRPRKPVISDTPPSPPSVTDGDGTTNE